MNIAIMAPHVHGNGSTTVASLLAASLSQRNAKVCLTHVKGKSESLFPYCSLSSTVQHSSPIQIVNLIKMGGMNAKNVPNYCRNVTARFDIFSLDMTEKESESVSDEDLAEVVTYMAQNAPYDYVIFDVDENSFDKPAVQALLQHIDCAVLVLSQKTIELELFRKKQKLIAAKLRKIPTIVVVNKFRDILGSIKEIASSVGVKNTKQWYTLHSNENVLYCENKGLLKTLTEQMAKKNGDVLDVEYDIQHIIQGIMMVKRECRSISNLERQAAEDAAAKKAEAKAAKNTPESKPDKKTLPADNPSEAEDTDIKTEKIEDTASVLGTEDPKKENYSTPEGFINRHLGSYSETVPEEAEEAGLKEGA